MAEYGVTQAGFIRKPYDEIKKEIEDKARQLFGEDADLSVYSPIGLFSNLLSWQSHILWQELETTYYANWLDTAEGVNLDRVVQWGGITRGQAQKAVIQDMEFTGTPGVTIPLGFKVETAQGVAFETNNLAVIDQTGKVQIICSAVNAGPEGAVPSGAVTEITNPITGLESVTNISSSIGGRGIETDVELRQRYKIEGSEGSGSSTDAIRSSLIKREGVLDAVVYENITLGEDNEGRPPKSIECIVLGGIDQDIAQTIFNIKSAGIETYGKQELFAYDQEGKKYRIFFNRPTVKNIYVELDLHINSQYSETLTPPKIMKNIIEYIGGVFTEQSADQYFYGLAVGEEVYPWRIAAVNSEIAGIEDISVKIGFLQSGEPATPGYHDIVPTESSTVSFTPTDQPNISGTFYFRVVVDGDSEKQLITLDLVATDSWNNIITKINNQLVGANASIESVIINEQTVYFFRITSQSTGESSTILITDEQTNGFWNEVDIKVANLDLIKNDPVVGMDIIDNNKLTIGSREIAQCENINIKINILGE